MKKILESLILPIIFLVLCGIPTVSWSMGDEKDVKVCDGFEYEIVDGNVMITGYQGNGQSELVIPATIENLPVTEIGERAFKDCHHLKSVTVSASVREIGMEMFAECYFLREICVAEGNPYYKNVGGVLFTKDGKKLLSYPYGGDWCYQVPEGVTTIGESAFNGCNRLLMIIIPENVTEIEMYAFNECPELTIIGKKGSEAEQYAEANRMKFRTIEEWEEFNKGF